MRRPSKHLDHLALTMRVTIDVGFIVVIFLMVTGKFKEATSFKEINKIQLPYATSPAISDPDGESATIYVGFGKIMLKIQIRLKNKRLLLSEINIVLTFQKMK